MKAEEGNSAGDLKVEASESASKRRKRTAAKSKAAK